jgi:hypothetical protein
MARRGDGIYLRGMTWPTRQAAGQRKRHHEARLGRQLEGLDGGSTG